MGLMSSKDDEEPAAKPKAAAPKPKEPEPDLTDMKAALFGGRQDKDKAAASSSGRDKAGASTSKSMPQDEDSARNALFAPSTKPKASTSKPAPQSAAGDSDDEDSARNALFAAKAPKPSKSKDVAPEDDEDDRAALFTKKSKSKKVSVTSRHTNQLLAVSVYVGLVGCHQHRSTCAPTLYIGDMGFRSASDLNGGIGWELDNRYIH